MFFAHSPDTKRGISGQSYADHISGVVAKANEAACAAAKFSSCDGPLLKVVVAQTAEFHDLGKLDNANQEVLSGALKALSLPIQHTDAGTAHFLDIDNQVPLSAGLIRSHHIGLPDFIEESNRGDLFLRDSRVANHVNDTLGALRKIHHSIHTDSPQSRCYSLSGNSTVFLRLALSCLADADHTDTAIHYKEYPSDEAQVELLPLERLKKLDQYVSELSQSTDERSRLRGELYTACRNAEPDQRIVSCDSPVGSGKTTAVMAHLLAQASVKKLRRIFIILPFTNIITQSVEVYRKALVLPGENPEEVVAELHHRADFQNIETRYLTALWKAPIIVTTAVTFFETLASNTPATLRRLHNLPGSAIFIDEAHAALPAKLLPLAWDWIKIYSKEWGCYWVLASGSLNRFWEIPEFDEYSSAVPEIVNASLRSRLSVYEKCRVNYRFIEKPLAAEELVDWIVTLPGPRIVVLNTIQSAAVIASLYAKKFGKELVEHLSTALSPSDRENTLKRVKSRLNCPLSGEKSNWTLIATSCVEAGIDISFRTGFRELGSMSSLFQIAGRVNRSGHDTDAEVWTFCLAEVGLLKVHPGLKSASIVLKKYLKSGQRIEPELCTKALEQEIRMDGVYSSFEELRNAEKQNRFPIIEKKFKVIDTDTRVVVIKQELIKQLSEHKPVNWKIVQENSVQLWKYKIDTLHVPELFGNSGLYGWNLAYDDFIGYMAGVLTVEDFSSGTGEGTVI